jgi:hypothetical protein
MDDLKMADSYNDEYKDYSNDNDVDICIGLGNFTGQKLDDAEISITSVSVTFLSANPTVLNDFE